MKQFYEIKTYVTRCLSPCYYYYIISLQISVTQRVLVE